MSATDRDPRVCALADAVAQVTAASGITKDEDLLEAVSKMPELWWAKVAHLAGTKLPSPETRDDVVAILRERARPATPAREVAARIIENVRRLNGPRFVL